MSKRIIDIDEDLATLESKIGNMRIQESTLYDLDFIQSCLVNNNSVSEALVELRKYLCTCNTNAIDSVLRMDVLEHLWMHAKSASDKDRYEITWILTNLSAGNERQTEILVRNGVIELMANFLSCENEDVLIQALWCIGNISGDHCDYREQIMACLTAYGGLTFFLPKNTKNEFQMKVLAWVISNLCRLKPNSEYWSIIVQDLGFCIYSVDIFNCNDQQSIIDFSWGLTRTLHAISTIRRKQLVTAALVNGLFNVIKRFKNPSVLVPIFRVLTNVVAGDNEETALVLQENRIEQILQFLDSDSPSLLKEALMCLSNIAASDLHGKTLHNFDILSIVLKLLQSTTATEAIKIECLWIISNCVGMREDILYPLIVNNLIETLIFCLKEPNLAKKAIDSLYFIELCSDGLYTTIKPRLSDLQSILEHFQHESDIVKHRSYSLLAALKRKGNKKDSMIEMEDSLEKMMIE